MVDIVYAISFLPYILLRNLFAISFLIYPNFGSFLLVLPTDIPFYLPTYLLSLLNSSLPPSLSPSLHLFVIHLSFHTEDFPILSSSFCPSVSLFLAIFLVLPFLHLIFTVLFLLPLHLHPFIIFIFFQTPTFFLLKRHILVEKIYEAISAGYHDQAQWWGVWDLIRRLLLVIILVALPGRTVRKSWRGFPTALSSLLLFTVQHRNH